MPHQSNYPVQGFTLSGLDDQGLLHGAKNGFPGKFDITTFINKDGINLNAQDENGNTAAHLLIQRTGVEKEARTDLKKLLDSKRADLSIKNRAGQTPLELAEKMLKDEAALKGAHNTSHGYNSVRHEAFLEVQQSVKAAQDAMPRTKGRVSGQTVPLTEEEIRKFDEAPVEPRSQQGFQNLPPEQTPAPSTAAAEANIPAPRQRKTPDNSGLSLLTAIGVGAIAAVATMGMGPLGALLIGALVFGAAMFGMQYMTGSGMFADKTPVTTPAHTPAHPKSQDQEAAPKTDAQSLQNAADQFHDPRHKVAPSESIAMNIPPRQNTQERSV